MFPLVLIPRHPCCHHLVTPLSYSPIMSLSEIQPVRPLAPLPALIVIWTPTPQHYEPLLMTPPSPLRQLLSPSESPGPSNGPPDGPPGPLPGSLRSSRSHSSPPEPPQRPPPSPSSLLTPLYDVPFAQKGISIPHS